MRDWLSRMRKAIAFLENVSYFRFAAYLRPLKASDKHTYKENATFEKAVRLYEFDAKLRTLLFSAIQKIEISLRAKVINQFSLTYGAFWFINPDLAIDKHKYAENLSSLDRELQRSKDDFIKEHYVKYGKENFPPAWKLIDLTSFGCLTKLYFNFANGAGKENSSFLRRSPARDSRKLDEIHQCASQLLCPPWACMESCDAYNAPTSNDIKASMDNK